MICAGLVLAGVVAVGMFLSFDTEYAAGYSRKAFASVRIGDTESEVLSKLGQPLREQPTEPYVKWVYSADPQPRFAESGEVSRTATVFHFNEKGELQQVYGQRQISPNQIAFGEGVGYLSLGGTDLKGKRQEEVEAKFGPPQGKYEDRGTKMLFYSHSPSSKNYHLRAIALDRAGKVVKIRKSVYWD